MMLLTGLTLIVLAALICTLFNIANKKVDIAIPVLLLCIVELVRSAISFGAH